MEETRKLILNFNSSDSNQIVVMTGTAASIAEYVGMAEEHNLKVEHITETRLMMEFERILEAIPKKKSRRGNYGTLWKPEEDELLIAQFQDGMSIQAIAKAHERTEGSILERLKKHKLIEGITMTEMRAQYREAFDSPAGSNAVSEAGKQ